MMAKNMTMGEEEVVLNYKSVGTVDIRKFLQCRW